MTPDLNLNLNLILILALSLTNPKTMTSPILTLSLRLMRSQAESITGSARHGHQAPSVVRDQVLWVMRLGLWTGLGVWVGVRVAIESKRCSREVGVGHPYAYACRLPLPCFQHDSCHES